jgi:hypothetical protein
MMAGSHVVVGVAAWLSVAPHLGLPPLDPLALALAAGGALLPDIDHPHSWVGRRTWVISRPLALELCRSRLGQWTFRAPLWRINGKAHGRFPLKGGLVHANSTGHGDRCRAR